MSDKPAKKFRIGYVTATIWKNDGTDRSFFSVELQRTYKDADGNLQNTNSMNHGDVPSAIKVLERAEAWVADQ